MNKFIKCGICVAVCCIMILLIIAFVYVGIFLFRHYHTPICIPLENRIGEIVIREWCWGLGSGAEIYYRVGFIELELGELECGDDGPDCTDLSSCDLSQIYCAACRNQIIEYLIHNNFI